MLQMAQARGANFLEAFSNAPMWWMCKNRSPHGGAPMSNNLKDESFDDFARYLAITVQYFKEQKGIEFTSLSPFNEPNFCYTVCSYPQTQERCGFEAKLQAWIVGHVHHELHQRGLENVVLTASDETSAKDAVATWEKMWDADLPNKSDLRGKSAQELVRKWNVHGYQNPSTNDLKKVHHVHHKTHRKPVLWMSEYGDGDESGMKLAQEIHRHMRYMKPTGWCLWQVVDPMWGLIDCDLEHTTHIRNIWQKYFVFAHFTRHIRPNMSIMSVSGSNVVAAYDANGRVLSLVASNFDQRGHTFTYDLSDFLLPGLAARWETNFEGHHSYKKYEDVSLTEDGKLTFHFPALTIMSFEFEDAILNTISV